MTEAVVKKGGGPWQRLFMGLTLATIAVVAFALWQQSRLRQGFAIQIEFREGHGLKVGDALILNGVEVGYVRQVEVLEDLAGILVSVGVTGPRAIASEGSQFWIPTFQFRPTEVSGADTIVGAKYIRVIPGTGPFTDKFVGLREAPTVIAPGDTLYELYSAVKPPVRGGSKVFWKGLEAGVVRSVTPAPDSSGVITQVVIRKKYVPLIRSGTHFYPEKAIQVGFGPLQGITLEAGSLEQILQGGLSFATPPGREQGRVVPELHRFQLTAEKDDEFDLWSPGISLAAE